MFQTPDLRAGSPAARHTADVLNESEMINETIVKVKGALKNVGIESFFSTVISTKKMSLEKLDDKNAKSKL